MTDPATWVDEYGDYLYRYALMRVRDKAQAEDLVQETLLAALQARKKFAGQSTVKTWLVGILKHKVIDYYRKHGREKVVDLPTDDDDAVEKFFDSNHAWRDGMQPTAWPNPTEDLESQEFMEVLRKCLEDMPDKTATVFSMREMEELSTDEICDMLGISPNNFWVIMHRARLMLRRCLELKWFKKKVAGEKAP